ncbi:hypothetical protein Hanom_Chr07g00648941 [Helianthus anomalus]
MAPFPTRLVFWDKFYQLGCNNGIRAKLVCCPRRKPSQPTRTLTFPARTLVLMKGRLLWTNTIARYGTCPTSVVWATNVGFITQMAPFPTKLVFWDKFYQLGCNTL